MPRPYLLVVAVAVALAGVLVALRRRGRGRTPARILALDDRTTIDPDTLVVRSVQAADVILPLDVLEGMWSPTHLERLARTYWRFLTRVTLGLVRVRYRPDGRDVFFLVPPLRLLTFQEPEYEMDGGRGIVRWRIERGLLVSRAGRGGHGFLEIEVRRRPNVAGPGGRLHVEVEVANFYPAIATGISAWLYRHTQSRIHVVITHGFLRSLARLDLAKSRVGRFSRVEEVPDPQPRPEPPEGGSRPAGTRLHAD